MNSWTQAREVEKVKDLITDANDRASVKYPSLKFAESHRLHVYREGSEWHVWLNTEAGDFDGLCITTGGKTRDAALAEAVRIFEAAIDAIQQPADTFHDSARRSQLA